MRVMCEGDVRMMCEGDSDVRKCAWQLQAETEVNTQIVNPWCFTSWIAK